MTGFEGEHNEEIGVFLQTLNNESIFIKNLR